MAEHTDTLLASLEALEQEMRVDAGVNAERATDADVPPFVAGVINAAVRTVRGYADAIAAIRRTTAEETTTRRASEPSDVGERQDLRDVPDRKGSEQMTVTVDLQVLKDAKEIMSGFGFLLMRMAVAKDAQDAYDVAKRECEDTQETLHRLQTALRHVPMQRPAPDAGATTPIAIPTESAQHSSSSRPAPSSGATRGAIGICDRCGAEYDRTSGTCINTAVNASGRLDACGGTIVAADRPTREETGEATP